MQNGLNIVNNLEEEIKFIKEMMDASDYKRRFSSSSTDRSSYNDTYKMYKRALWDVLHSCNKTIYKV